MVEIEFLFNGSNIIIQGKLEEKIETILNKFINKAQIEKNSVYYLYQGKILKDSNKESKLSDIMVNDDKVSNKMKIIIYDINDEKNKNNSIVPSKNIICPDCKEISKIKINDYKINLLDCKNGHNINGILLSDFQNTQKIDISQIICQQCKEKNKSITHNNEFYRCINCKLNLCPLCKSIHDNYHYIINYEKQYYICNLHKEFYSNYCEECKLNICNLCTNEHKDHKIIAYKDVIPNISDIKNQLIYIRNKIDKANKIIKQTIDKLNKIIENNEIYYNIFKEMIKSYDDKNINYELLQNLKELKSYNYMDNIKEEDLLDVYYSMIKKKQIKMYKDGKYEGEFKNNLRDGKGIMYYNNDNKYEGEWKNDFKEGKGIMYYKSGNKYVGEWKNDDKEGEGIMYYKSGNKYEGEYRDNVRKKGTYTFINGEQYIGEFNDKRNGKGIFYYNNGNKYEGNFVEDKREGYGEMLYFNGDNYKGNWVSYKREGKGIYYYKDGRRYEGNWVNDKKEGKGIFYYKDGSRYEGDFEDDMRSGEGIIYYADGTKKIGEFSEDEISEKKRIIIDKDWNIVRDDDDDLDEED